VLPRNYVGKSAFVVFIRTSPFIPNEPQYSKTLSAELPNPTDDTRDLLEVADVLFNRLWREGFRYMKAGVMLADFYEYGAFQQDLLRVDNTKINSKALMNAVDKINHSGLGNVFFASQGVSPQWAMKREHLSPAYTTRWEELPKVW
jgi:DNA polymerase V